MSTTRKVSIKGLKIGEDQFELLGETVKELVGDAGTVTIKDKDSEGLRIRSRHAVSADAKFADIKVRFHHGDWMPRFYWQRLYLKTDLRLS